MKCQYFFVGAVPKYLILCMKKVSFYKHANKMEPMCCVNQYNCFFFF